MQHKKGPEGKASAHKAREARWRYLLRNHEFRADLNELRGHYQKGGGYGQKDREVRAKWNLLDVPFEILIDHRIPDLSPGNIEFFETFFERPGRGSPVWSAVEATDLYDNEDVEIPGLRPGQFLEITVDLRYPLNLLVSLIEQELREALKKGPSTPQRRRLDKIDFYLQVYDRAEKGETFPAIAKALQRPVSTVKSGYLAASRNIYGLKAGPSKKALPLTSFDGVGHCQHCPICQKAQTPEELCPKALLYANQGLKGQKELTGFDTVRG